MKPFISIQKIFLRCQLITLWATELIESLKVTVIVENTARMERRGIVGKHGFCSLIEAKSKKDEVKILLDAGSSADVVLNNAKILGVDLSDLDAIVVSHGHYDHTGGLLEVLKMNDKLLPVIAHPNAFKPKFASKPKIRYIGNPFRESEVESKGGILVKAKNPVTLFDGLMTTGEIVRRTPYEKPKGFWTISEERYVKDEVLDDQAVIADLRDKGLVVVTGCAHSGIINTILHSREITGVKKVHAVLGGFHLVDADENKMNQTIESLREFDVSLLMPGHCTGYKAVNKLMNAFGEKCRSLRAGEILEFR